MKRKTAQGFTLIELLIVIAIIAILAVIVLLILNPGETNARARDSKRLTDLQTLQQAITITAQENPAIVYCVGTAPGTSCPTTSNNSATGTSVVDGTGWVKINLTQSAANQNVIQISALPLDPVNTTGANGFHYTYCTDNAASNPTWELATKLEAASNATKMANDGGGSTTLYEVGSKLTLISGGTCAY